MNKKLYNHILSNYDVLSIEQHLFHSYIESKSLDFKQSNILGSYFEKFTQNDELCFLIKDLNTDSIGTLENYLELLIPKNDKKINGAFFTPSYVVDFIISNLSPSRTHLNVDPSCGCGAFLLGLLKFYQGKFDLSVREIVKNNIYGSDLLDYNVRRAKILITIYALANGEILHDDDINLYSFDSLRYEWDISFDNVIGNPPYVKFQDLSEENRRHLISQSWSSVQNGNFNLYFPFFELGLHLLKTGGKLGYITPNNYFTSLAGKSLRKFFHEHKCVIRVVDFRDKKIFDAQTYTAITFISKSESESILYDRIKKDQLPEEFLKCVNGSPNDLSELNVNKWRLLKKDEQRNIRRIENIGVPLGDLFDIKVGIATLKDSLYFITNPNLIDGKYYRKIIPEGEFLIEKEITKSVYKISELKKFTDLEQYFKRVITPYHFHSQSYSPIPLKELQSKFPKCYQYFNAIRTKLEERDKGKKRVNPFYLWGRSQGIISYGKKILTPTFSSKPSFILADQPDSYFTNGYGIILNESKQYQKIQEQLNVDVLLKILNSRIMEYYVDKTSVTIQGDYPCYQKNFIEKFSIPNLSQADIDTLKQLKAKEEIDDFLSNIYQVNMPLPNLLS